MIDEKKLIEELIPILNEHGDMYLAGKILGMIDMQPSACFDCTRRKWYMKGYQDGLNAGKWISVEETLPESYEYVLVWCKGNFICGTHEGEETQWYGIGVVYDNKWAIYQCKDIKNIEVIAWRFLPDPYKKEGAE